MPKGRKDDGDNIIEVGERIPADVRKTLKRVTGYDPGEVYENRDAVNLARAFAKADKDNDREKKVSFGSLNRNELNTIRAEGNDKDDDKGRTERVENEVEKARRQAVNNLKLKDIKIPRLPGPGALGREDDDDEKLTPVESTKPRRPLTDKEKKEVARAASGLADSIPKIGMSAGNIAQGKDVKEPSAPPTVANNQGGREDRGPVK